MSKCGEKLNNFDAYILIIELFSQVKSVLKTSVIFHTNFLAKYARLLPKICISHHLVTEL